MIRALRIVGSLASGARSPRLRSPSFAPGVLALDRMFAFRWLLSVSPCQSLAPISEAQGDESLLRVRKT